MEFFTYLTTSVGLFWRELVVWGAAMVSIIIALIGLLKFFFFNKIGNKAIRKMVLAVSNLIGSFGVTSIYFGVNGRSWQLYWLASLITASTVIIAYWVYENFSIREGVHKLGIFAIDKLAKILKMILSNADNKEVIEEINKAKSELKALAKNEITLVTKKLNKKDKDLENL